MALKSYLEAINKEIAEHKYGTHPQELYEPLEYIMSLGGKRLRPALTLMSANLWLYNWQKAVRPALAVEVFHNFTLMHDDIMDQAPLRRSQATVHEKWDINTAILSGDVMLVAAYELLAEVEDANFKHVIKRFNRTAAEVCEGQQLDMMFASKENVSKEEYIEMIRLKTSVLLGFALELGAIVAGADQESIDLLYSIGVNLGLGFQVKDDILDVYGEQAKVGKQIGGDIIENKKTWLMIDALEKAEEFNVAKELNTWLQKETFNNTEKVEAVKAIFDTIGVKQDAELAMHAYFNLAFDSLKKLNVSEDKKLVIKSFAEDLLKREH